MKTCNGELEGLEMKDRHLNLELKSGQKKTKPKGKEVPSLQGRGD